MLGPTGRSIVTTTLFASALVIAMTLLFTVHHKTGTLMPWSKGSKSTIGGIKFTGDFGVLSYRICGPRDICFVGEYDKASEAGQLFKNAFGNCPNTGKAVTAMLSMAVLSLLAAVVLSLTQMSWRAKTLTTSNAITLLGLLTAVVLSACAAVWDINCSQELRDRISIDLSWGFGLALGATAISFIAMTIEMLGPPAPAPYGDDAYSTV